MNLIEFHTKVNLQRFLDIQEITDVEARRHPYAGWLAYSKDTGYCRGLLIDLIDDPDIAKSVYANLAQNHPDCFDVKVVYNKKADVNFQAAVGRHLLWKNVFLLSQKEMRHIVNWTSKDKISKNGSFKDYLIDQGYAGFIDNQFGALTDDLIRRYPEAKWPDWAKGHKRIVIPSWLTPNTLFSLEVCHPENTDKRAMVYCMDKRLPKGWYGSINSPVVEKLNNLAYKQGLVWSPYCPPFLNYPLEFDPTVQIKTFIDIFTDPHDLTLMEPAAKTLEERAMDDDLLKSLCELRKGKAERLQQVLGVSLMDAWLASRKEHTFLGDRRFLSRAEGYFEITDTGDKQITDFVMDIDHFEVKDDQVLVHLEVTQDGNFHTFIAPYKILSKVNFVFNLKDTLMRQGIRAVYIDPAYAKIVPELIQAFSPDAKLELTASVEAKKQEDKWDTLNKASQVLAPD